VSPTGTPWKGPRGSIWQQQAELRELADAIDATFVVIDSAAVACGGADSLKPEAPGQYFPALRFLGRPSLTLAHVTKGDDLRYPFGSVFWHNLARVTWSAEKVGALGHQVILSHRKGNNHAHQGRQLVTITWRDGLPGEVWEETYNAKLAVLISGVLKTGPMTVARIVAALNEDTDEGDPRIKAGQRARRAPSGHPHGAQAVHRHGGGVVECRLSCRVTCRVDHPGSHQRLSRIPSRPCRVHAQGCRVERHDRVAKRTRHATRHTSPPYEGGMSRRAVAREPRS
jgi:hypothetical protein